jgi:hypothetical protein
VLSDSKENQMSDILRTLNQVHSTSHLDAGRSLHESMQRSRDWQEEIAGRHDARGVFRHILATVREFQAKLQPDEELGLQIANFGLPTQLHVRTIGYADPNIVEFFGALANGENAQLIQHIGQLNLMLIAVPPLPKEKAYRIGFKSSSHLE